VVSNSQITSASCLRLKTYLLPRTMIPLLLIAYAIAPLFKIVHCYLKNPVRVGCGNFDCPLPPGSSSQTLWWLCCGFFSLYFFDNLGNKEGENKKGNGEKHFEGKEFSPVSGNPDIFQGSNEKSEDKGSHDDAESRSEKIIPEVDFG
jgi:hypothetical protein